MYHCPRLSVTPEDYHRSKYLEINRRDPTMQHEQLADTLGTLVPQIRARCISPFDRNDLSRSLSCPSPSVTPSPQSHIIHLSPRHSHHGGHDPARRRVYSSTRCNSPTRCAWSCGSRADSGLLSSRSRSARVLVSVQTAICFGSFAHQFRQLATANLLIAFNGDDFLYDFSQQTT